MSDICGVCKVPETDEKTELRPYGIGGSLICFGCAMKQEDITNAELAKAMGSAFTASPGGVVLGSRGPAPVGSLMMVVQKPGRS